MALISAADKVEILDCLSQRGWACWENDLLDTGKSAEIKGGLRTSDSHRGPGADGVFPITRTSRAPSPPSRLFNWPQTKSEREQCDGAERKGRAEGAHRSLESSGWSPLLRKEIERVNSNGGSVEHRLQCWESVSTGMHGDYSTDLFSGLERGWL